MELVRCASVFDTEGNFCPAFDEVKESLDVDQVILAIGQAADLSFVGDGNSLKVERGLIVADEETLETQNARRLRRRRGRQGTWGTH